MPLLHRWRREWAVCDQLSLVSYSSCFAPSSALFDFAPHPRGWAGRFTQIMDHVDVEPPNHLTQGCNSLWLLRDLLRLCPSLQIASSIQILRLGKCTLIANPIYWSHTLCSQVSVQKAGEGQEGHGMGEEKPWRIRGGGCLERRVSWANVSSCSPMLMLGPGEQDVERRCELDPSDPQVLTPLWWDGAAIPPFYFREHSHFSESWKSCLKPSKW